MDEFTERSAVVCTGNAHKVHELGLLLPDFRLEPLPAGTVLPPEVGSTFVDNARIKAHAGQAMYPGRWLIADDSGLLVDALDGRPGVHSARFAGAEATDAHNVSLLLERMAPFVDADLRTARFACVLVLISPSGEETIAEGLVEGTIAAETAGAGGFGYDPVFIPEGHDRTFAELGDATKSRLSHRARAARALQAKLLAPA